MVSEGIIKLIPASPLEGEFIIADRIQAVKDSVLAERQLDENLRFLNAKSRRYKKSYGDYPENLNDLKEYIDINTTNVYPEHPLGEDYFYDPEAGEVTAAKIGN